MTAAVVTAVITFAILGFVYLRREAVDVHGSLDALMAKAEQAPSVEELHAVRRDLVVFAKEKCWHRVYGRRACEICAYIDGRLKGL